MKCRNFSHQQGFFSELPSTPGFKPLKYNYHAGMSSTCWGIVCSLPRLWDSSFECRYRGISLLKGEYGIWPSGPRCH